MSSSKKSTKKQNNIKSKKKKKNLSTSSNKLPKSGTRMLSIRSDTALNEEKPEYHKRRPRSPLSPLREWIHKSSASPNKNKKKSSNKSTKKTSTKKERLVPNRRPRSASNGSIYKYPSKYTPARSKSTTTKKAKTPKHSQSNYKLKRMQTPSLDPQKQLKFTKKNNKITLASPKHNKNNKKKQSYAKKSSLKSAMNIVKAPPRRSMRSGRSKSVKRGSFFSRSRQKKSKKEPKTRSKSKSQSQSQSLHKKNKSFKDKIHEFTQTIARPTTPKNTKSFNANIMKQKEKKRSSLNMHKMRMIKALREEHTDDDILTTDESSSLEIVKLNGLQQNGRHHKRGSSGIPSFFQQKLHFDFGQYLDEKARIFIAYCMRIYALRITENIFEVISTYHVLPFSSGFICMMCKDDDQYSHLTSISYHYPLIQLPASSMPTLDGIQDDRLGSIVYEERQQSPHSMPLPNTNNMYSLSWELKQFGFPAMIPKYPYASVKKTRSAEALSLSQSESVITPIIGDGAFCEDMEDTTKTKEDVIKKYKKKIYKKRQKDNEKKKGLNRSHPYLPHTIPRSASLDKNEKEIKNRIFYSSGPELSEDETIDDHDTDVSAEADDGFPDVDYAQLLHYKHRLEEEVEVNDSEQSKSLTNDTKQSMSKNDTPTITTSDAPYYYNDIHPPASPSGNGYDTDIMTPKSPTLTERPYFGKEFELSFDDDETQRHRVNDNNNNNWIQTTNGDNGVGIAEWTLLSTPKVIGFDCFKKGVSVGLGIGGFIDRTRGVCGVSLAPIYYQYGGMDKNERYYDKLDIYNLYTGDYVRCCNKLPFNDLYDTASSIVRSGYQSTLVISGGQYYGRDIFDDNMVQNKTYLYAPWINSKYHHQISAHGLNHLNDSFIDKHGIRTSAKQKQNKNEKRRKSIGIPNAPLSVSNILVNINTNNKMVLPSLPSTPKTPKTPTKHGRKRTSSQFAVNMTLNFDNILTRPSSRSISHAYIRRESGANNKNNNNNNNSLIGIRETRDDWLCGPSMITARAHHGSISWDEHIVFCCGGFGSSARRINNVEMLRMDKFTDMADLNKLRWKKCESMSANKSNLVLIHWKPKTCIVSVGAGSKVVESYDPYKDTWKDLPPLNTHQISNKSCRFYYDLHHQANCLMFLKFRNGIIKSMEYLDERMKVKRWTLINDQYIDLFNSQFDINYLQNIKSFCFA